MSSCSVERCLFSAYSHSLNELSTVTSRSLNVTGRLRWLPRWSTSAWSYHIPCLNSAEVQSGVWKEGQHSSGEVPALLHQFKDLAVMWSRLQLVQVEGVSRLIRGFLMEESCCSIGPWHETIERPVHCWPIQQRDLSCVLQGIVSHCAGFRQQLPDKGIVRSVWANGTLIRSAENKGLIFRACVFWSLAASWNLH